MIEGVVISPLKQMFDERGKVMHMLRSDSPLYDSFGEIYFSCTYPGAIKAWHLHKQMTLNYAAIYGEIKCVLFDDRPGSKTRGCIDEYYLSPENYFLLTVKLFLSFFEIIGFLVGHLIFNSSSFHLIPTSCFADL